MDRRVTAYLALAFGISWAIALAGMLFGIRSTDGPGYTVMAALFMLGPATAAIIRLRFFDRGPWSAIGLRFKGTRWGMLFVTMSIGVCIVPSVLLVIHLLGDGLGFGAFGHASVTTDRMLIAVGELLEKAGQPAASGQVDLLRSIPAPLILMIALLTAVFAACTVNLPFMLGEELGWRGYLFQHTAHWAGLRRVLFTGVVWGLWHAPLIVMGHNYPGYPVVGIGMMVLFCILLAFLFDWARVRSKSIWAPAVLHGIINGSAGAMVLIAWDGHVLVGSAVGLAGLVGIGALAIVTITVDGKYRRLLFRPEAAVDVN